MWISSSSSSSVVFLYTGLSKFILLVFFRFQFLQMRYPPMHSKPMTTEERGKKGLLARHESAGMFPCRFPSLYDFLKAKLLFPHFNSFCTLSHPQPWKSERCIYTTVLVWSPSKVKLNQLTDRNDNSNNSCCHSWIKALVIICICNYRSHSHHLTHLLASKSHLKNVLC